MRSEEAPQDPAPAHLAPRGARITFPSSLSFTISASLGEDIRPAHSNNGAGSFVNKEE